MRVFKSRLVVAALVAAAGFGLSAPAATSNQPRPPLRVAITEFNGLKRFKVARKLSVSVKCNRNCGLRVKGSLRMPVGNVGWSAARGMKAGGNWVLSYRLSKLGLRYLRQHWRTSWYVVRVAAKDVETGKRTVKVRNFRFRR